MHKCYKLDKSNSSSVSRVLFESLSEILYHEIYFQILITSGGDLDLFNRNSQTPLHVAVKHRNSEIVQLLLLGGCNVDKVDENRKTPLMYAAQNGFDDIVQVLVNGGMSSKYVVLFYFKMQ